MKVAIDISQIVYGTGVSVYTRELITQLSKTDGLKLVLFAGTLRRRSEFKKYKAKIFPISPSIADLIWNRLHILPIEKLIGNVDVVHTSDWSEPPSKLPKVTTVHDLAPVFYKEETDALVASVHKRRLEWVKKESDAIVVPSKSTKEDLVNLGFEDKKIHVIYEALSSNFKISKSKPIINGKYILSVGTAKRKNISKIAKAYKKVKAKLDLDKYVVVGQKPENPIEGVEYIGKVSDSDIQNLYTHAECLVYASKYEGFGLPILEAFASRLPVVTSNKSSMPEVAGNAAVLVDPKKIDDISNGIVEAIRNKKLLVKLGVKRLKKFSWEKNAEQTAKIYKSLL